MRAVVGVWVGVGVEWGAAIKSIYYNFIKQCKVLRHQPVSAVWSSR